MSQQPLLVVIHGAPGVGKTTLCRELARRVKLPALSKDHIKEDLLYARLEQSDRAFSRIEGEVAVMMLYAFADTFLKKGRSVIIENAFYVEVSRDDMRRVIEKTMQNFLRFFAMSTKLFGLSALLVAWKMVNVIQGTWTAPSSRTKVWKITPSLNLVIRSMSIRLMRLATSYIRRSQK